MTGKYGSVNFKRPEWSIYSSKLDRETKKVQAKVDAGTPISDLTWREKWLLGIKEAEELPET